MKFIYNTENLFFDDYQKMINKIGGYKEQFTSAVYKLWIDEYTQEKNQKILVKNTNKKNVKSLYDYY